MTRRSGRFLALLRGINVGGQNVIRKQDLRATFEDIGLEGVRTYIQSGNVLFRATETSATELTDAIEAALSKRFRYDAQALVLSHRRFAAILRAAPPEWGERADERHNALFTLRGVTPRGILTGLAKPDPDVERIVAGPGVLFWSVSRARRNRSVLLELPQSPLYRRLTIRNHNTVFKLGELLDEA